MLGSLKHYWRINLAVILGGAIATAVLTGALLVGDSVKGSLRDLTLERLGKIDYLLVRHDYFREGMADELSSDEEFITHFEAAAPLIITNGNAVHAKHQTRASRINVIAAGKEFLSFYDPAISDSMAAAFVKQRRQIFASIVINASLQKELNASVGDQILLSFEKPSDIARGSLLGEKDTEHVVETARFTLTRIIPEKGIGRFSIQSHQTLPLNAYVSLPVMQKVLEQHGNVNAIAVAQKGGPERDRSSELQQMIANKLQFEDLGLQLKNSSKQVFILESKESILSAQVVALAESTAQKTDLSMLPSYTYLANKMVFDGRVLPYSTVTALPTHPVPPFESLTLRSGAPAPNLAEDELLVNEWVAQDLAVRPGDVVTMSYFAVGSRDELYEKEAQFKIAGVLRMTGLAADRTLTPEYPGIADADNMADWDPPFEVDLSLIRKKDEDYWDAYRGTPKAFVSLATGQKFWGSRFGNITSIKLAAPEKDTQAAKDAFLQQFVKAADPQQFGYQFQPVKAQGLKSSSGATDFGGLFIGFSQFLIVSAALLVGLLFRLGIEQRGKEVGMLLALGHTTKKVRNRFLAEGAVLAVTGALVGLAGAVFYAWLLMVGLRTWWVAAVGSSFLFLHVTSSSLVMGYFISVGVILLSIWLGFRKLSKLPAPALLAGVTSDPRMKKTSAWLKWIAMTCLLLALLGAVLSFVSGNVSASPETFFGVGTLLLISGLCYFSLWLRSKHRTVVSKSNLFSSIKMAARNTPRNPGRSMLSAALVACACFIIVAVAANRHDFDEAVLQKDSGSGGFTLVAQADVPLQHDLSTDDGRFSLGFSDKDAQVLAASEIIPFRFLPGDDASCLNLYQVEQPRVLGVPTSQTDRGGFTFQSLVDPDVENPWQLLTAEPGPDVIPAFGDANSVLWILHSGLGKDIEMTDEFGKKIKLRFVGLLQKSIFQSELLISEEHFLRHFPSQSGYAYYLIKTPSDQIDEQARILESTLSDYGFDSSTTVEKLAGFQAVENTYLSTFQTLGGLGLLLGTLGLGMILIRNVIERRGELATLRAFGYKRSTLGFMVLLENAFLLMLGIAIGGISALAAVAPNLITGAGNIPWLSLAGTLILVFVVGLFSSSVAVSRAVRIPLLAALRAD